MDYSNYEEFILTSPVFFQQIHTGWNIYKLKHLIRSLESGKRKDFEDANFAFSIGGEHVNWNGTLNLSNERYITKEFYNSMSKGKINKNDILLVKDGATIGKTAFVKDMTQKMAVNEHVFILRNNKRLIPKLLYFLIKSHLGFTQIKLTETGSAQGGISQNILDKVVFPIPVDLKEQKQIVNYLDIKTAKIDATISKNKELIQLLEEKRVILINQVVTKGLNLDVPTKDSGIEWIGEIPEHWECRKINTLSSVNRGASPRPIDNPIYFDENGEYSWVRISDVTSSNKYLEQTSQRLSTLGKSLSVPIEPGNIFISIAGTVGKPIIANIKCCIHDGFVYFKNLAINDEYLFYIFAGGEAYKGLGKLGTQLNLNTETIGGIYIPVPSNDEQMEIIDYLDKEINKVDTIIKKVKENIALLEEYKTSLIHHTVTGKIDVSGEKI